MAYKPAAYLVFKDGRLRGVSSRYSEEKLMAGYVQTSLYEAPPARRVTELLEANNKLVEERRAIAADRDKLALIVKACAVQFRYYEMQHRGKQTHDGDMKAKINADFASICENATK